MMQQILLSSQNILPGQTKVASTGSVNSQLAPQNKEAEVLNRSLVYQENNALILKNQEDRSDFINVLNGLDSPEGTEPMQNQSLAEWKTLLNENPALREKLEENPEFSEQLIAFIEGQGLSKEGEILPPLIVKDPHLLGLEGADTNSDAVLTLQQVINSFLSEQPERQMVGSEAQNLEPNSGDSIVLGGELTKLSIPYVLVDKNDASAKPWARTIDVGQTVNSTVAPTIDPQGRAATEYAASLTNGGNTLSLLQGSSLNGFQTEADAQFKASFESFSVLDPEAGDLLEPNRTLERGDTARTQFSEIQSKLQGSGLKQYTTSLETNVQDPEWGDEVGQKIVWLTGRSIQSAEIHLNPADLGPIEVQIKVHNEQATVTFHAQNNTVREMLESNVHRLRDMMETNGVDLAEVSVGSENSGGQYSARDGENGEPGQQGESGAGDVVASSPDESVQISGVSNRIVDFYA